MIPFFDEERCRNCRRLVTPRHHPKPTCTRSRIPKSWPEWSRRRAAMEEAGDGFCAMCDRPIPLSSSDNRRVGRYTCGLKECRKAWDRLAQADCGDPRLEAA